MMELRDSLQRGEISCPGRRPPAAQVLGVSTVVRLILGGAVERGSM